MGARRAVDVGVDDAGGDRAEVEGGGAERPVLLPAEVAAAACPTAPTSDRRSSRAPDGAIGSPSQRAPPPRTASKRAPLARLTTRAASGPSASTAHRLVANHGMPRLAFVEPSSGSSTTVTGAVGVGGARTPPTARRRRPLEHGLDGDVVGGEVAVVLARPACRRGPSRRGAPSVAAIGGGGLVEQREVRRRRPSAGADRTVGPWPPSTSPASSPTSRTTPPTTASTSTTSATSSRRTRCARRGRSTSTPRRRATGPLDLHLSLEVDPRQLLAFEDVVRRARRRRRPARRVPLPARVHVGAAAAPPRPRPARAGHRAGRRRRHRPAARGVGHRLVPVGHRRARAQPHHPRPHRRCRWPASSRNDEELCEVLDRCRDVSLCLVERAPAWLGEDPGRGRRGRRPTATPGPQLGRDLLVGVGRPRHRRRRCRAARRAGRPASGLDDHAGLGGDHPRRRGRRGASPSARRRRAGRGSSTAAWRPAATSMQQPAGADVRVLVDVQARRAPRPPTRRARPWCRRRSAATVTKRCVEQGAVERGAARRGRPTPPDRRRSSSTACDAVRRARRRARRGRRAARGRRQLDARADLEVGQRRRPRARRRAARTPSACPTATAGEPSTGSAR